MIQEEDETVDQFVIRLKQKVLSCDFGESNDEFIRDQVIDKCHSIALHRKLLERGQTLTLKDFQEISCAHEASHFQASKINDDVAIKGKEENVNSVGGRRKERFQNKIKSDENKCFRCDKTGHYAKSPKCPATSAECNRCHKKGHFANVCKTRMRNQKDGKRGVNSLEEDQESEGQDSVYVFVVNAYPDSDKAFIDVDVGGVTCNFLIDSGSTCNVVDKSCWEGLKKEKLDELEAQGIIEKVKGPARWANHLVVIPKPNGEIRLCTANEAIVREKFLSPQ